MSFLLTPDAPGYPKPIKLQEQHKALFPLDKPINEESGRLIAEWASGGSASTSTIGEDHSQIIQTAITMESLAQAFAAAQKWARSNNDPKMLAQYVADKDARKKTLEQAQQAKE